LGILLTAARTNWYFEFAQTAKIFNTKFANHLKKCQRLLLTFADICYFSLFFDVYAGPYIIPSAYRLLGVVVMEISFF